MYWLALGVFTGTFIESVKGCTESRMYLNCRSKYAWYYFFIVILYSAPAIGGFVILGQMLMEYGVCIRIA